MSEWKWPVVYLMLMASVALAASLWGSAETCEMDGQEISPGLRVDLGLSDGSRHAFCSIECARRWLARRKDQHLKDAIVRDALTGEPIDSYTAFFVRSAVVTNQANGNNIHAFQFRTDAVEHIHRFHGEEIDDPFSVE